jgi:hypothetical protein
MKPSRSLIADLNARDDAIDTDRLEGGPDLFLDDRATASLPPTTSRKACR